MRNKNYLVVSYLIPLKVMGGLTFLFSISIYLYQLIIVPMLLVRHEFIYFSILGVILFTANKGLKKGEDKFKLYYSICFLKFGKWNQIHSYNLFLDAELKGSVKHYGELYSYGNTREFQTVLLGNKYLLIKKYYVYEEAKVSIQKISNFLGIKYEDKWLDYICELKNKKKIKT
ncbi:MAG: hypothetical protein H6587_05740 [Flavobacteriales bacterium]|nr:hypothetical protein [Flavobacteriales bacterium]MCB9364053.1 hypothetical protein [Flavobacteriales bacterium]